MTECLKIFKLERDFYSTPQVIIVTTDTAEAAELILNNLLKEENNPPGIYGPLIELDLTKPGIIILSPPGDRHMDR
jgi:hypothetical protein